MHEEIFASSDVINAIASRSTPVCSNDIDADSYPNKCLLLKHDKQSLPVIVKHNKIIQVKDKIKIGHIKPRSLEQLFYMRHLLDNDLPLVLCAGRAGSGKTLLALAVAVDKVINGNGPQDEIILTKSLSEVGRYRIGTVPGDTRDKLDPYLISYKFAFRKILGEDINLDLMEDRGRITFLPINTMRGVSIENAIVIVDEAQNLTAEELRTIGTRMSEGARLFLLGDITQSDESCRGSGMLALMHDKRIRDSQLVSSTYLERNERSPLSKLLDDVLFLEN